MCMCQVILDERFAALKGKGAPTNTAEGGNRSIQFFIASMSGPVDYTRYPQYEGK